MQIFARLQVASFDNRITAELFAGAVLLPKIYLVLDCMKNNDYL